MVEPLAGCSEPFGAVDANHQASKTSTVAQVLPTSAHRVKLHCVAIKGAIHDETMTMNHLIFLPLTPEGLMKSPLWGLSLLVMSNTNMLVNT